MRELFKQCRCGGHFRCGTCRLDVCFCPGHEPHSQGEPVIGHSSPAMDRYWAHQDKLELTA